MNEEEKKAIDELNSFKNIPNYVFLNEYELLMQSTRIVLNLIEKLQKENEELKEINNELEAEKNEAIRRYNFEAIPIKKVKDKIKGILDNSEYIMIFEGDTEFPDDAKEIRTQKYIKLERIQELIEEKNKWVKYIKAGN